MNLGINARFTSPQLQTNKKQEIQFGAAHLDIGAEKLLTENIDTISCGCAFVAKDALTAIDGISHPQVKAFQKQFPHTVLNTNDLHEILKTASGFDRTIVASSICLKAPNISEKDVKKVLTKHSEKLIAAKKALRDIERTILNELGI